MFRITGRVGVDVDHGHWNNTPVLITHGLGMDAVNWAESNGLGTIWPLQLVDRGYDVWMASNRGTAPYSDNNKNDGQWTEE